MPGTAACPDPQRLQNLLHGQLAAEEVERLAEHLESCAHCAETVAGMKSEDTLVEALRGSADTGEVEPAPVVQQLIERLKQLRVQRESTSAPTLSPTPDAPPSPASTNDLLAPPPIARAVKELLTSQLPSGADFLAPPQSPDELGRLGPYRVLKELGAGGMGTVFLAEDPQLQRHVALKAMKPSLAASAAARQRFLREARATAAVKHDHIVIIHQVGEDRGIPFIAMELLEGETLDERLRRESKLVCPEILRLGQEIARGLAAAHKRGLLHRDIKPANIWLETLHGEPGASSPGVTRVKILDFGLARAVSGDAQLTQEGAIIGTPAYMAPEQATNTNVDHRCDLFSLGCVLYRMAAGIQPFKGTDTISTLMSVATDQPVPPCALNFDIPTGLSDFIMKLLDKSPAKRPASAQEVAERLRALEREQVTSEPRAFASEGRSRTAPIIRKPRRGLWVAAAVAVLGLLTLGWFFGGTIIRIATNEGELVIEIADDAKIEVTIKDGEAIVHDQAKDRKYVLTAGKDYDVQVRELGDDGVKFGTKRFTITRGGKAKFDARVELAKAKTERAPPGSAAADPDRSAAEWVLGLGGNVSLRPVGTKDDVNVSKDLPFGNFQVIRIELLSNWKVTDEELQRLPGLANLRGLVLGGTGVSDASLEKLKRFPELRTLDLSRTGVGDAGLPHLTSLGKLGRIHLDNTRVSDAGVKHLTGLVVLTSMSLTNTSITDAALEHLRKLPGLEAVKLAGTKVTADGVKKLAAALPKCQIDSDHGTFMPKRFTNALGMEFALIPKGKAWLGGGGGKVGDKEVEFKDDFYLGVYEVTQEEWLKIMGSNPSHFSRMGKGKSEVKAVAEIDLKRFPVEGFTWKDCQEFLARLNEKGKESGWVYRLPTEAEWEYACRGGPPQTKDEHGFDYYLDRPTNKLLPGMANFNKNLGRTSKVGSYSANPLGLYDMHGNVWELCSDTGFIKGTVHHANRGGCWDNPVADCRTVSRHVVNPFTGNYAFGLRVARVRVGKEDKTSFTNSLGMEFALVPKGKAWMGGMAGTSGNSEVELKDDFYFGIYEVTQEEWQRVMGVNPSEFTRTGKEKEKVKDVSDADLKRLPVTHVSWNDCQEFITRLNERTKESGWVYRMPKAAEWQYACRGGSLPKKEDYAFDYYFDRPTNTLLPDRANFNNALGRPAKVGSYPANSLGLFDMHGNMAEWCEEVVPDGKWGIHSRATRGGGFSHIPEWCKTVFQVTCPHGAKFHDVGLRLARVPADIAPRDPDRRAAEWVLSIGGSVRVNDQGAYLKTVSELPSAPFRLAWIALNFNSKMTDAMLPQLQGCENLIHLDLGGTKITDAGMSRFPTLRNLTYLSLGDTPIGDAGLAHIKDCKNLKGLYLAATNVTDQGLGHLKELKTLTSVRLTKTQVTADGVKKLATALPQCNLFSDHGAYGPTADPDRRAAEWVLSIGGRIQVNELPRNITALADLPSGPFELTAVWLPNGRKVSDEEFANFRGCQNLTLLNLGFTHVSDAGLANFKDCKKLRTLSLSGWGMTDAGLASFKDCKDLSDLTLYDLKISSAGLAHFANCRKLTKLSLSVTNLAGVGLEAFKDCKDLTVLNLVATGLSPAELVHFKDCKKLDYLNLERTLVNDSGLVHLKDLANMTQLYLNSTRVTNAGLAHLKGLSKLQSLNLKQTKVTADEVKKLAAALPQCKIDSDHGTLGPEKR